MIASVLITNPEIFAFIAFLVFKLFSRKKFVYKQKRQKNCLEVRYFLRKNIFVNILNVKSSDTLQIIKRSFGSGFSIYINAPFEYTYKPSARPIANLP